MNEEHDLASAVSLDPVAPYVRTRGRTEPSRNTVRPETLLRANTDSPAPADRHRAVVVDLCRGGLLSLIEVAAYAHLSVSGMAVIVSELLDNGHLVVQSSPDTPDPSLDTLEKVLSGLRKL